MAGSSTSTSARKPQAMAARSFQSGRGWRSMEKRGDFKNKWGMDRGNREGSNHPKMSAIQQRSVLVQYQYSIASPTRDKKNLFAVNHYIGSWSRYNGRSDPRRSKEVRDHVVRTSIYGYCMWLIPCWQPKTNLLTSAFLFLFFYIYNVKATVKAGKDDDWINSWIDEICQRTWNGTCS